MATKFKNRRGGRPAGIIKSLQLPRLQKYNELAAAGATAHDVAAALGMKLSNFYMWRRVMGRAGYRLKPTLPPTSAVFMRRDSVPAAPPRPTLPLTFVMNVGG